MYLSLLIFHLRSLKQGLVQNVISCQFSILTSNLLLEKVNLPRHDHQTRCPESCLFYFYFFWQVGCLPVLCFTLLILISWCTCHSQNHPHSCQLLICLFILPCLSYFLPQFFLFPSIITILVSVCTGSLPLFLCSSYPQWFFTQVSVCTPSPGNSVFSVLGLPSLHSDWFLTLVKFGQVCLKPFCSLSAIIQSDLNQPPFCSGVVCFDEPSTCLFYLSQTGLVVTCQIKLASDLPVCINEHSFKTVFNKPFRRIPWV